MLKPSEIENFKEIYQRKYGVALSDRVAVESAGKLLDLIKLIIRPPIDKPVNTKHLIRYGNHEN